MKTALIGSWVFFAVVLAASASAEDFMIKGYRDLGIFKAVRSAGALKWDVHLDDEEVAKIKEACK